MALALLYGNNTEIVFHNVLLHDKNAFFVSILIAVPFLFLMILQAITSSGTQKGDLFLADISTLLKNKNITTDLKVDTSSNVSHFDFSC